MQAVSGSFSGSIHTQTVIALNDEPNHSLGVAEVRGTQSASDPKWDKSSITYWGATDMRGLEGVQRGYFLNDHGAAGQDHGTFEGTVSLQGDEIVVEGQWKYTGGKGEFAGISGRGTFKTKLTSPTTVEAKWEGAYELVKVAV